MFQAATNNIGNSPASENDGACEPEMVKSWRLSVLCKWESLFFEKAENKIPCSQAELMRADGSE